MEKKKDLEKKIEKKISKENNKKNDQNDRVVRFAVLFLIYRYPS